MKSKGSNKRKIKPPTKRKLEENSSSKTKESFEMPSLRNLSIDSDGYDDCIMAYEKTDFLQNEVETMDKIPGVIKDAVILLVGDSETGKSLLAYSFTPFPRKQVSRYTKTVVDLAYILNRSRSYIGLHIFCAPFRKGDYNCFLRDPLDNPLYDLVIFIFDINDVHSLKNITKKWYPEVKKYLSKRLPPLLVVGNKLDRVPRGVQTFPVSETDRVAFYHEGERCASQIGAHKYIEVSALTGNNINHLMKNALELIC